MSEPATSSRAASKPKAKPVRWIVIGVVFVVALLLYRHYDLGRLLTFENLKASRDGLVAQFHDRPLVTVLTFFGVYVLIAALSIPGAGILTLAAGAMFGLGIGTLVVSFASCIGATIAFLIARYLLRDWVQARFGKQLKPINEGMRRDGLFYLLSVRMLPIFPFFVVNLLAGLTPLGVGRFYWVSQLGMLASTAVFVNAGTQLADIQRPADVLSPALLLSFALLGIFPLIAKAIVGWLKRRKVYANWKKPASFDRNLVVIGAGSGGLVTAYIAAAVKAKVTLIESHKMGGDCLNFGCVPSKTLIRSAKLAKQLQKADALGICDVTGSVDFAAVMARVHRVIAEIEPHDSIERYKKIGVDAVKGYARIISPWSVEITTDTGKQTLTTRSIVIATGARPHIPPIPGLTEVGCLTSANVWGLTERPRRLIVLGGGPIGCELAQSFARLGSKVTQVEMGARVLSREDPDAALLVAEALREDGIELLTGHEAMRVEHEGGPKRLIVKHGTREFAIEFDEILVAVGRQPRVEGFGLEDLGIPITARKTVETDAWLQTLFPNIFAVGDVAGPYQLTHAAAHQAWYAAVNALFGRFKRFKADYSVMPWATFTDPEVARVGLSETEAKEQGIACEVTKYGLDDLDRAITDGTTCGYVKVLTVPGKDKILGVAIVGEHAGDLLAEFALAMKNGLGLNKVLGTVHTYPTLAEANKSVAGEWRRAHMPHKLLAWAERFHAWERA